MVYLIKNSGRRLNEQNKIKSIVALVLCFRCVCVLFGHARQASDYTTEQHIQRMYERIEKRFMAEDNGKPTGFEIKPLYNENGMLNIFLVEFEPYGYLYVLVGDELNKVFGWLGFRTSMYRLSNSTITRTWSPYTLNSTTSEQEWILDEDGNKIVYDRSPFYVANAGNAKYYLLESEDCYYIPAIKTGEDFVNLISGEKFPFQSGQPETAQACECIYFIGKKYFDL
ncbi:MAG: hypothetical protein ACLTSK_02525 [Christensenellales bacterium]